MLAFIFAKLLGSAFINSDPVKKTSQNSGVLSLNLADRGMEKNKPQVRTI